MIIYFLLTSCCFVNISRKLSRELVITSNVDPVWFYNSVSKTYSSIEGFFFFLFSNHMDVCSHPTSLQQARLSEECWSEEADPLENNSMLTLS